MCCSFSCVYWSFRSLRGFEHINDILKSFASTVRHFFLPSHNDLNYFVIFFLFWILFVCIKTEELINFSFFYWHRYDNIFCRTWIFSLLISLAFVLFMNIEYTKYRLIIYFWMYKLYQSSLNLSRLPLYRYTLPVVQTLSSLMTIISM
jgi:hypothetical protein